jgi:hypothetical protein
MIDLGPATENDMVLAFLKAEVDSARFKAPYQGCFDHLKEFGFDRQVLLHSPDLQSAEQNAIRKEILKVVRGYTDGQFLFIGFPVDVTWRRTALEPTDLAKLRYANYPAWVKLSGGTRRVMDGAANVDSIDLGDGTNAHILAVAADVRTGKRYPELIGVTDENEDVILIEGHTRATAYALTQPPEQIECIIGSSPTMRTWAYY